MRRSWPSPPATLSSSSRAEAGRATSAASASASAGAGPLMAGHPAAPRRGRLAAPSPGASLGLGAGRGGAGFLPVQLAGLDWALLGAGAVGVVLPGRPRGGAGRVRDPLELRPILAVPGPAADLLLVVEGAGLLDPAVRV